MMGLVIILNNYKAEQHNGYGLIIMSDLTWGSVGLRQLKKLKNHRDKCLLLNSIKIGDYPRVDTVDYIYG